MADQDIRRVVQVADELYVDGGNGLWYELREAVSGGQELTDFRRGATITHLGPAAPDVARQPVTGFCPMGCGQTLARRTDGAIGCMLATCPRPTAAAELLADDEGEHIVELKDRTFTVRHPLRERLDDALMRCTLDLWISRQDGPPQPPGLYRVEHRAGGWHWTALEATDAH